MGQLTALIEHRGAAVNEAPSVRHRLISAPAVVMATESSVPLLRYEPLLDLYPAETPGDKELAQSHGKRIGILIVAYNAITTLPKVLKRITPNVWNNVEEVAVFDDASQDA